jgi:hypothetical protein
MKHNLKHEKQETGLMSTQREHFDRFKSVVSGQLQWLLEKCGQWSVAMADALQLNFGSCFTTSDRFALV